MNNYVIIDGEEVDTSLLDFIDISEGPMGEDRLTFDWKGEVMTKTVYRKH